MSDQEQRDRQTNTPYIDDSLVINSRLSEVERQQREDKANQQKHERSQRRTNWLLTIFTGLLFITSLISDLLMLKYVALTKQSADASTSAAFTAEGTLRLNADLFKGTYGAVVAVIPGLNIGSDVASLSSTLTLTFTNTGKVVGRKLSAKARMERESIPSYKTIGRIQTQQIASDQLFPFPQPRHSEGDIQRIWFNTADFMQEDIVQIKGMHESIKIDGILTYENGFGDINTEPFCFMYLSLHNPDGSSSEGWIGCAEAKFDVTETLKRQQGNRSKQ